MARLIATILSLMTLVNLCIGQSDKNIPLIEDFETENEWPWNPWNISSNGSSTKSIRSARSGKFGLNAGNYFTRTDKIWGTSGQVISFWIRFIGPSRAHCGFGFRNDSSIGFFLCVDPSTKSLHFSRSPDYTYPMIKSTNQTYKLYVWYRVEIKYNTKINVTGNLYKSDGITLLNSITCEIPTLQSGGISFRGDGIGLVHLDEIRAGTRITKDSSETYFIVKKEESTILRNILFDIDKNILLPSSYAELDKLVSYLRSNSFNMVNISGHTDNTGDEEHNKKLALDRAKAVADYLVKNGINKTKISYNGFGSSKPIFSNDSADGKNRNRRVEFIIH